MTNDTLKQAAQVVRWHYNLDGGDELPALANELERMAKQQGPSDDDLTAIGASVGLGESLSVAYGRALFSRYGQPASTAQPHDLPERDTSKPAEQQGLFRKFIVRRADGSDQPGGKHHGCRYFVLDVDHDAHASAALTAYAAACEATHPGLARDLREKWGAQPGSVESATPFGNCEFRICDLPGQCRSEGKCHHPRKLTDADRAEICSAALEEASRAAYLRLFPKNERSDWTTYADIRAEAAEEVVKAIDALKTNGGASHE